MEVIKRKLAEKAPVVRSGDERTETYGFKIWEIRETEGLIALVYNKGRQRFEKTTYENAFYTWLGNWFSGKSNEDSLKEVVQDARAIKANYGFTVGAWYVWEYGSEKILDRSKHKIANFIYYKIPYGYNLPWAEENAD